MNWDKDVTINEMPVGAAICEPEPHAALRAARTSLRGYAIATGRAVARVDVSADGGRNWAQATLEHEDIQPWNGTLWNVMVELPAGEHELALRAWDVAGQTQPALPDDTWNFEDYLSAAWHRVPVRVAGAVHPSAPWARAAGLAPEAAHPFKVPCPPERTLFNAGSGARQGPTAPPGRSPIPPLGEGHLS